MPLAVTTYLVAKAVHIIAVLFAFGIPVGKVTSTRQGSGGLALDLVIEPLADIDNLSYVSVMRWESQG